MRTGTAATMKPGETKVEVRPYTEDRPKRIGVFIAHLVGNRALVRINGVDHTEYLSDLEIVTE